MSGLAVAARYLTILPAGRGPGAADAAALGRAVPWFPVVGLGIGAVLVGLGWLAGLLVPGLLASLLTVTAWKLLSGGLHLDGLADCLDGLGGWDPAQRLRIMSDSRIGAFGVMGLILFLLLEVAALAELPGRVRWATLLAAPAIGRATPAILALVFSAAKVEGQGARWQGAVRPPQAAVGVAVAAAAAVACLGALGLAALGAGFAAALGAGAFFGRRLGGVTGDVLGAAVELGEAAVLLTVTVWTRR